MKLIVGLGNPGMEYKDTRHNVGFMILDNYLDGEKWNKKENYEIIEKNILNEKVIFLKPLTYMNLSGKAVKKIMDFYKIDISDLLVIHDDVALDVGTYRIKRNSSSGGHNGVNSIILELGTNKFSRLKIGIGFSKIISLEKYVLGKFSLDDKNIISRDYEKYGEIINCFIKNSIDMVMSKYNHKIGEKNEL